MKGYFQRLARYSVWANARLYDAVGELSHEEFIAPRTGFFPSLAQTMNHMVVTDRIWLGRLTGVPSPHTRLDEMPYARFDALRSARQAEDERMIGFFNALPEARLESDLHYRNMAGEPKVTPMDVVLGHFFNHQTHHRGQAHAMLAGTRITPPSLDLIYFFPQDRAD
jgi:uncharacterized damage-inducible protein DinB